MTQILRVNLISKPAQSVGTAGDTERDYQFGRTAQGKWQGTIWLMDHPLFLTLKPVPKVERGVLYCDPDKSLELPLTASAQSLRGLIWTFDDNPKFVLLFLPIEGQANGWPNEEEKAVSYGGKAAHDRFVQALLKEHHIVIVDFSRRDSPVPLHQSHKGEGFLDLRKAA